MAQPTVTARPADWAGTSGPILYKLTSTNYANAGYRLEVEIWNNVSASKIADAVYYPDSTGNLACDISSFLKTSLANDSDLTTSDVVYSDGNWINYYIKYRELWAAGSETQVNDSANDFFAVYGGLQIGSTNNLADYVTAGTSKKFLTLMNWWRAVKNYPFTFSFINGERLTVVRKQAGSTLTTTNTTLTGTEVRRGKHKETGDADTLEIRLRNAALSADESVTMVCDIIEECNNTIVLQWKNSLGGDECFPFQINQEYTWNYSGKKAKRLTLYADNLTLNQWEVIQGLNTLGEIYRINITEMTTSLNRTSDKVGQSVNILNSDGTKTGVIVISQANTTQTKQVKHSAIVTIEYPELFLQ